MRVNSINIGFRKRKRSKDSFSWSSYWKSESDLWVKSRSENSLVDDFGNNPVLLMPTVSTSDRDAYADSGVTTLVNTIWVLKGKLNSPLSLVKWQGSRAAGQDTRFFFGTGWANNKINFAWGDTTVIAGNDKAHDFDWHVFIMYDKRFWVLDKDTILTDASILNIIATETPLINHSGASWTGTSSTIEYGRIDTPSYINFEFASSFIGTITAGNITWQRKHIFSGNLTYIYDILNKTNLATWEVAPVLKYSENGSFHFMDVGYSLYLTEEGDRLIVPYLLDGNPSTDVTVPSGYTLFKDYSDSRLFIDDCKIRFLNNFFDRSDTDIYNDGARGTNYDSSNKKDWLGYEFNRFIFENWINTDYKYRPFIQYNIQGEDSYPTGIILAKNNELSKKDSIFNWCNDCDVSISISQLDRHIDHQNGNKIFGFDATEEEIFYSSDNGANYTTMDFTDAEDIGMSFVFNNGNILFATAEKVYLSTDGLQTINEIDVTDQNGDPFPIVAGSHNFINVRFVDSQILGNGKQMITFGSYLNVSVATGYGYVCLFYSIEGESLKTAYMFGQNALYDSYGDPTNPIIARHVHSSTYSPITGKWYWNTGDHGASEALYECHFFESEYNYITDVWTNTKLLSSDDSTHIKAGALISDSNNIYFGSDATKAPGSTTDRGMFKTLISELGTYAKHKRLINYDDAIIGGHIILNQMGVAFPGGIAYDAGKYKLITYSKHMPFVYNVKSFEAIPEQTDPDEYGAWKLVKVSEKEILANTMRILDARYVFNTIKISII